MGKRVDPDQLSLLDWRPAPEPVTAKKVRKPKAKKAAPVPVPTPEPESTENGSSTRQWHYARDRINNFNWQLLLKSQEFTTPVHIAFAVRLNLTQPTGIYVPDRPRLSVENARAVMAAMGWPEPEDRSDVLLRGDGIITGGWKWKPGDRAFFVPNGIGGSWLAIHALEDGWVEWTGKDIAVTAKWVDAHPHPVRPDRKAIVEKSKASVPRARASMKPQTKGAAA